MESKRERRREHSPMVGGLILVAIGVLALIGQWAPGWLGSSLPALILGGMGLIFIIAGIATRESGFFIPGGILGGLGAGLALIAGPFNASAFTGNQGGLFLIAFAAGWFLIPILSTIFGRERHLWAVIPGTIIGLVGLAVYSGGVFNDVLVWIGKLWPLALIAGGLYALYKARSHGEPEELEEKPPVEKHA